MRPVREGTTLPRDIDGIVRELSGLLAEFGFRINRTLPKDGSERVSPFTDYAEVVDQANPSANTGRLFVKDNGAGKSQLCVRFGSGATQVIATEP